MGKDTFDYEGARNDGYSDADIITHRMKMRPNFKLDEARKDQTDEEIAYYLSTGKAMDTSPNPGSTLTRSIYSGLTEFSPVGAITDEINKLRAFDPFNEGNAPPPLSKRDSVGSTEWLREKGRNIKLPSGTPLTYESKETLPRGERPLASAGEVISQSLPFAFAPFAAKKGVGMFKPIVKAAQDAPKTFLAAEMGGISGAASASAASEYVAPGNEGAKVTAEVVGGMLNPVSIVARASKGIVGGIKSALFTSDAGRELEAGRLLRGGLEDAGEDIPSIIRALEEKGLISKDGGEIALSSGQKSGSPTFNAVESRLIKQSAKFGIGSGKQLENNLLELKKLINVLADSGDPALLREAAKARQSYFDGILSARFNQAQRDVTETTARFGGDKAGASREASRILSEALDDARGLEHNLWNKVDPSLQTDGTNILAAYDELASKLLPAELDDLPKTITDMVDWIGKNKSISSGELQRFRSRMLAFARDKAATPGGRDMSSQFTKMANGAYDDLDTIKTPEAVAARTYSKQLNDAFSRTFAGDALGVKSTGAQRIDPELMLTRAFGGGDARGKVQFRQLEGAAQFANKSMRSEQEEFLRAAASASLDESKKVNTAKLQTFLEKNAETLKRFPELRDDMSNALSAERAFKRVTASNKIAKTQLQRTAFAQVLSDGSPATTINRALSSRNPEKEYAALVKLAKRGGPGAVHGLKASTLDHAIKNAIDDTGNFSFAKLGEALTKPTSPKHPSILDTMIRAKVMTPQDKFYIEKILKETAKIEVALAHKSQMDIITDADALFDVVVRIVGARAGTSSPLVGNSGTSLVAAQAGSKFARGLFEKVPSEKMRDVLIMAMQDPKFAAALLRKAPARKPGIKDLKGAKAKMSGAARLSAQRLQDSYAEQINAFLLQAGLTEEE